MKTLLILTAMAAIGTIRLEPDSRIWVDGGSTVRDYSCRATGLSSTLTTTDGAAIAGLVGNAVITVPVAKLDCGNSTMNDHMRKALEAKNNPNITFELSSYALEGATAVMQGTLTIAGTSRPIEITGTAAEDGGMVRVTGAKQIRMSEWGVKPPSLMLGTMKVKDDVTIGFDVTLKR